MIGSEAFACDRLTTKVFSTDSFLDLLLTASSALDLGKTCSRLYAAVQVALSLSSRTYFFPFSLNRTFSLIEAAPALLIQATPSSDKTRLLSNTLLPSQTPVTDFLFSKDWSSHSKPSHLSSSRVSAQIGECGSILSFGLL